MQDRLIRGLMAGIGGGIIANLWSFFAGSVGFTQLRYADWTAIVIYGRTPPFSNADIIWATITQVLFCGILGIVFALLIPLIKSQYLVLKGLIYGALVWMIIYIGTTLFKVEGTMALSASTSISNTVAAFIYGGMMASFIIKLTPNTTTTTESNRNIMPQPAMKPLDDYDNEQNK